MKKLAILVCVLAIGVMAPAGVIFQDTFENRTANTPLAMYDAPTTGQYYWINYSYQTADATYQNDGGNMVLRADRLDRGAGTEYVYLTNYTYTSSGEELLAAGAKFKFSYNWKSDGSIFSGAQSHFNFGGTPNDGLFTYANGYNYYIEGAWYGAVPAANVWHKVEMVVTAGAASGGYVPITYDVYADGVLILANAAGANAAVGGNARMDLYVAGGGGVVLYDNVTIERIPEPATMALLGLGALTLIRKKK